MRKLDAGALVWVSDDRSGIRRLGGAERFFYKDPQGVKVTDSATLERIRHLAIPPAYRDVWICPVANGHLQATGRDARGRKQYRYHPQWQAERGLEKFGRLWSFGEVLPRIRAQVERDLRMSDSAGPSQASVLATLVRLLDTTFLRIGNEAYVQSNGSYGLTTLRNRHARVTGRVVRLRFRGKSGVVHEANVNDRRVAAIVRRCQHLPGQELFQYADDEGELQPVGSAEVNAYLEQSAGTHVTAKDFRTWHGTVHALELALGGDATQGHGRSVNDILAGVARRLGNTPAVCRKAYVHPAVLALAGFIPTGGAVAHVRGNGSDLPAAPGSRALSSSERRLMALLRAEARELRRRKA